MTLLHRVLLLSALGLTAVGCYVTGHKTGTVAFIVMGVGMELLFWLHLLPRQRKKGS